MSAVQGSGRDLMSSVLDNQLKAANPLVLPPKVGTDCLHSLPSGAFCLGCQEGIATSRLISPYITLGLRDSCCLVSVLVHVNGRRGDSGPFYDISPVLSAWAAPPGGWASRGSWIGWPKRELRP